MDAERDTILLKTEKYFWKDVCIFNTCLCQMLNDSILYLRAFCYPESLWSSHDISLLHESQQLEFIIHLFSSRKRTREESKQHK